MESMPSLWPSEARDRTITSLAILKVNYDQRGLDYIDYFVPFVSEAMRLTGADQLRIGDIEATFQTRFGLKLPRSALQTVLRRASRRGLVEIREGTYYPDRRELTGIEFEALSNRALADQQLLQARFGDYAEPLLGRRLSHSEESAALLGYVQARGVAFLRHALDPRVQVPIQDAAPDQIGFITSGFVIHANKNDPEAWDALQSLVKGAVLAGATYSADPGRVTSRFQRLDVYLDTRILLRLLGLAGAEHEAVERDLVDLGYTLGASFYCFEHTLAELRAILIATARALRYKAAFRKSGGETFEYMASQGFTGSDVELVISNLESRLRSVRVGVKPSPSHVIGWTIDEGELGRRLEAGVTYRSDEPLLHDINSVTSVQRLRRNESFDVLEGARAVFVTTNFPMARVANQFFHEQALTGFVPVVYTEQEFGTICWLKSPTRAPDLPVNLVIADTLAALNPPGALWRAYLVEIDRLEAQGEISEDEYMLLRFSSAAKSAVMDVHYENPGQLTTVSVPEVLARTREAIITAAEPELVSRGREAAISEAEAKVKEQVALRDAAVRAKEELSQRLVSTEEAIRGRTGAWAHNVGRIAFFATFAVGVFIVIAISIVGSGVLGTLVGAPRAIGGWSDVPVVAVIAVVLLGIANLVTGGSVLGVARLVEVWTGRQAHNWLLSQFGPVTQDDARTHS